MKQKTLEKMAQQDAHQWARAEMFFGEGAGTQRKLLWAEINKKLSTIPEYKDAFDKAYISQDFAEHAIAAARTRQKLDRVAKAGQNLRALKSGNLNNLTTGVAVIVGAVYLAHATGADKVIEAEAKRLYKKAKVEYKFQKARLQGRNVEKLI
jgi:hypothetical protein